MARHKAISKARWLASQKWELNHWRGKEILDKELARIEKDYMPLIKRYAHLLGERPHILDLCCGPVCTARFLKKGVKTFQDPLLDDFRRAYPGEMPKGERLTSITENIPKPNAHYDLILCIDALDHVMNPELVLNEMERLLKPNGICIVTLPTFSSLMARTHYFIERFIPVLRHEGRPYAFTRDAIKRALSRHFEIVEEKKAPSTRKDVGLVQPTYWIFVCKAKEKR